MTNEIHFWYDPKLKQYVECSAEEAWAREDGEEKIMELGPVYTPPTKKMLTDTGTRFEHINDLLDYLSDGLIAVENSLKRFENEKDEKRSKRLSESINIIRIYQESLANMAGSKWDLNNTLDKCVPERGVLEDIRKTRIEALKTGPPQKSLPAPPEDADPIGV